MILQSRALSRLRCWAGVSSSSQITTVARRSSRHGGDLLNLALADPGARVGVRASLDHPGQRDRAGGLGKLSELVDRGFSVPVVGAPRINADKNGAFARLAGRVVVAASAAVADTWNCSLRRYARPHGSTQPGAIQSSQRGVTETRCACRSSTPSSAVSSSLLGILEGILVAEVVAPTLEFAAEANATGEAPAQADRSERTGGR